MVKKGEKRRQGVKGRKSEKSVKGDKGEKGVKGAKGEKGGRRRGRKMYKVPPPESKIWPEEYRGKRWKSVYAILFAGRCQVCAYSSPLPRSRQLLDKWLKVARMLLCTNHPSQPGELSEVLPIETCRNFKAKPWKRPKLRPTRDRSLSAADESSGDIRRIPLGHGLFAIVDADDYEALSKYRWRANHQGRNAYAVCQTGGRVVCMHRMIMRPRRGYVVDHIDGNGLNNRRCNLRICTRRQNLANRGPCGGTSRFVGVSRKRDDKWQASIVCHAKFYYLGLFDDEVEAAKARDRKAYELHGEYAYLNFPEDFAEK